MEEADLYATHYLQLPLIHLLLQVLNIAQR
jgi:hypothetical protein